MQKKGILQTALIVGVLSETLVIPPDEKRILASVDRQSKITKRMNLNIIFVKRQIKFEEIQLPSLFNAHIRGLFIGPILYYTLISRYKFQKFLDTDEKSGKWDFRKHLSRWPYSVYQRGYSMFRVRASRSHNRKYIDALWQWRRVKTSTDSVGQSLQKEFLIDDTGTPS